MLTAPRPITLEQFLRLRERKPSLEFEDGEVKKVPPKHRHSRLQAQLPRLIDRLGSPSLDPLPQLRVTFAGQSPVPDLAVFRRERLPVDERGEREDDVFVPPDAPTGALRGEAAVDLTDLAPELRFSAAELFAALRLR
jgi:Uma2 family endonuclease